MKIGGKNAHHQSEAFKTGSLYFKVSIYIQPFPNRSLLSSFLGLGGTNKKESSTILRQPKPHHHPPTTTILPSPPHYHAWWDFTRPRKRGWSYWKLSCFFWRTIKEGWNNQIFIRNHHGFSANLKRNVKTKSFDFMQLHYFFILISAEGGGGK